VSIHVLDVHQHSGPWPFCAKTGGIELNLELMHRRGIDTAIISSARAILEDCTIGNAELARDLEGHTNLYGYVVVNPNLPEVTQVEIKRYADNPRFVGFKVHSNYAGCSIGDARMVTLLDVLAPLAKPVLLHTWGAGEVLALQHQAERHPGLSLIMAHAGADAWRVAIQSAQKCANLYLDFTSSTPYSGALQRAVDVLGPGQVLLGTDSTLFDPLYMLAQFQRLDISDKERGLIMAGNAQRIFNLATDSGG